MIAILPTTVAAFAFSFPTIPSIVATQDSSQPRVREERREGTSTGFQSDDMIIWVTESNETLKSVAKGYYGNEAYWTTVWNDNSWLAHPENLPANTALALRKTVPQRPETLQSKLVTQLNSISVSSSYKISSHLQMPLDGYRYMSTPFRGGHPGVDLVANHGAPVFAAADGTVVEIGWSRIGYGKTIVLDHGNGMMTRYAHLSIMSVKYGQFVAQGNMIGNVGCTGRCSGNHLHFEVYRNGMPVNPFSVINRS